MTEFMKKPAANHRKEIAIVGSTNKVVSTNFGDFILNKSGKSLARFVKIYPFENGYARVEFEQGYGVINTDGEIITKNNNALIDGDVIRFKHNGKWGLKSLNGKILCKSRFKFIEKFNDGLARVQIEVEPNKYRWGVINKQGKYVIQPVYLDIGDLGEQIIAKKPGGYGVMDRKGNEIHPFIYRRYARKPDGLHLWDNFRGREPVFIKA